MDEDLTSLIPLQKDDLEKIDKIIAVGYPKIKPILHRLLEWFQDMNWPVAQKLASFLSTIGNDNIPEIKKIMLTNDYIWQYWCLGEIVFNLNKDGIRQFEKELVHIRESPSKEEKNEFLDKIAAKILEKFYVND